MEIKKTKRANLEKSKSVFTLFGMILTLSLVWFTFEYKVYDKAVIESFGNPATTIDEDVMLHPKPLKPPPPPPKVTVIKISDSDKDIDFADIEIDVETYEEEFIEDLVVAVEEEEISHEDKVIVFLEDQPEYPGGDEARLKFLSKAIVYPQMARESSIQGIVYVTFVVEKNGKISNVKVLRGIGGGCDEAAVNAIKRMPPWKPGRQRGRVVRAQFNMPVQFILEG